MKRIIIVNDGGYGLLRASKGDYNSYASYLKLCLEEELPDQPHLPTIVNIIDSYDKVLEILNDPNERVDTLIFLTRGMMDQAKMAKSQFPFLKVILLTGNMPQEEIILIGKGWNLKPKQIQSVIL